jgi:hypothetical protein
MKHYRLYFNSSDGGVAFIDVKGHTKEDAVAWAIEGKFPHIIYVRELSTIETGEAQDEQQTT